ncbi:MAG TPA: portal protein [Zeimonas sp.]
MPAVPETLAQQILRRAQQAKSDRALHESVWRECLEYTWPELAHGITGETVTASDAQAKKARQLDGTGRDAAKTLAAGLIGGLVPANAQWFELDVGRESDEEKRWLSEAAETIWENIHVSNFDAAVLDAMKYEVAAGWFALYIDEAPEGGYSFECWPMGGVYASASRKGGRIDTVYRSFELTVEQCVNEYGENGVSEEVREKLRAGKLSEKVALTWAIYPRTHYVIGPALARNKRFASVVVEDRSKKVVRESGYDEFPVVVPRWAFIPGTDYATGPFSDALPDVKSLNKLVFNELAASDLAVGGMWVAVDDGVLNPRTVKVGPRKIISAASTENIKELKSGADFNVAWTEREQLQAQIRRTLMADQLQPQDKAQMTAYEVHVRVQLIRQLLGPIFGRLQTEFLQALIERCFGIAYRAGVLGAPPESLAGRSFTVKYVSPLARAQKLEEVTAIEAWYASLGQLAQAKQDPSIFDIADDDAAARTLAEGRGVPARILRSVDDIAALRESRAEAQEQAKQSALMETMQLEGAKQAAQVPRAA